MPVPGFETTDGTPLTLAWPGARVGVQADRDDDGDEPATEDGWVMVGPDAVAIARLLATQAVVAV